MSEVGVQHRRTLADAHLSDVLLEEVLVEVQVAVRVADAH